MSLQSNKIHRFGTFTADTGARTLRSGDAVVALAPKTFDLLCILLESGGRLVTKEDLMASLWPGVFVEEANVAFQISTLRKALGEGGAEWIVTVPKHGYRFVAEVIVEAEPGPSPAQPHRRLLAGIAGIALASIGIAAYLAFQKPAAITVQYAPATPLTAYPGSQFGPSLSADGNHVAFSWDGPNQDNDDIYVKLVGAGEPIRLTTDEASDRNPAWSPDGSKIAFVRMRSGEQADIFVLPALGGAERRVARIRLAGRAGRTVDTTGGLQRKVAWTPDGKWLAFGGTPVSHEGPSGIWLTSIETGDFRQLTETPEGHMGDWSPQFSPNGQGFAFVRETTISHREILVSPFSMNSREVSARLIAESRASILGIAWTADGNGIISSMGGHLGLTHLFRVPVSELGAPQPLAIGERAEGVTIAPTGRLVYESLYRDANFWRFAVKGDKGGELAAVPGSVNDENTPNFSPDGRRLAFASTRTGNEEIWISNSDGSNPVQMTSMKGPQCSNPQWSRDGKTILFNSRKEGSSDLYLLTPDTGELRRITDHAAEELEPRWSRDGRWIYFGSNRTGTFEVWRMPAEGGEPVRITFHGGSTASESPDGQFLYYAKSYSRPTSIWRVPPGGGEELLFAEGLTYSMNFAAGERGLYLLAEGKDSKSTAIEFIDYDSAKRKTMAIVAKRSWFGVALSPDQKSFLFSIVDREGSNLMLADPVKR